MSAALPPLTRLLMVAEWLESAAAYQDRPGAMAEHEATAAVLRDVHDELRNARSVPEQAAGVGVAEWEAYEAWLGGREDVR